ncbi:MAG: transposase [Eubacteriales bacterium]|nr:transposase [Eubacteriales bacterium]
MHRLLYLKSSVFKRLFLYFEDYFSEAPRPTARNLFLLVISILTLDIFRSVRFAHSHVITRLSDTSLNAFYYTLKTDSYDHSAWNDITVSKALRAVPGPLEDQPLFLSIDDTMVEKSGTHFELCSKLYDHAAHNGSNYLNGHCMVSLLISFPVYQDGKILYLSVPVGYKLWDKESSKLALAAELVKQAMKVIDPGRQVILLCDSWYPKGEVAALVEQFENLEMVCNARVDTALYGLPPAKTGKRGRPRKHGDRIRLKDIVLSEPQSGDWLIGIVPVITNLWKGKVVYALVTAPKNGKGSRRLFLCTADPETISFDWKNSADKTACSYGAENVLYLPLAWYCLRWNIEISYYEGKTFWSMEEYRVRSKEGIERLVNLISLSYSAMTLLPYSDESFSGYQSASAQEPRYEIGQQIQSEIILCSFGSFLETIKNCSALIKVVEDYILSGFRKFQKL